MSSGRRAVFLDRDGTLVDELGYLADPQHLLPYPGIAPPLRRLQDVGYFLCLVTNQSGVARGLLDEATLELIHQRLQEHLRGDGVELDAILYCPHHPDLGDPPYRRACLCRKPGPGLFLEAASRHGLDLPNSWSIGDSERDLDASARAGIHGRILVLTGKGKASRDALSPAQLARTGVVPSLAAAAEWILTSDEASTRPAP